MFLECTLIQWRQSVYTYCTQVAEGTLFFMKFPVCNTPRKDALQLQMFRNEMQAVYVHLQFIYNVHITTM